jgi:hypothetical protein
VVRYSVLRLLIFFGVLAALWLLGLRGPDQQLLLLVLAAAISMAISVVVLRPFREDYSRQLAQRLEARARAKQQRSTGADELAEDSEDEGPRGATGTRDTEGPRGTQGPRGVEGPTGTDGTDNQGPVEYR